MVSRKQLVKVFDKLEVLVKDMGKRLARGDINAVPIKRKDTFKCENCNYISVCGYSEEENLEYINIEQVKNPFVDESEV